MTAPSPLRIVSLESRHAAEMARLLERNRMRVLRAPSMQEVPLGDQGQALAFARVLLDGECDALVLLTGVGTRMLVSAMCTRFDEAELIAALGCTLLLARGPKPVAALKTLGLKPALVAPSPNTWRELIAALDGAFGAPGIDLSGKRVWVQEYGRENPELIEALTRRAGEVHAVPIYAWQLPEDLAPLRDAVAALCAGEADAVCFTSAQQLDHLLRVAGELGRRAELERALRETALVASIGPITSDALRAAGVPVDLEPEHPKMGHLVRALAEQAAERLARKLAAVPDSR